MAVVAVPRRFEVWLVNLDLTLGSEINKTQPCVVISPDELNRYLRAVTIAALTSAERTYLSRVNYQLMLRTISIGCLGRAFSEVAKAAFQRSGQITA